MVMGRLDQIISPSKLKIICHAFFLVFAVLASYRKHLSLSRPYLLLMDIFNNFIAIPYPHQWAAIRRRGCRSCGSLGN